MAPSTTPAILAQQVGAFARQGGGEHREVVVVAEELGQQVGLVGRRRHHRRPGVAEQPQVVPVVLHPLAQLVQLLGVGVRPEVGRAPRVPARSSTAGRPATRRSRRRRRTTARSTARARRARRPPPAPRGDPSPRGRAAAAALTSPARTRTIVCGETEPASTGTRDSNVSVITAWSRCAERRRPASRATRPGEVARAGGSTATSRTSERNFLSVGAGLVDVLHRSEPARCAAGAPRRSSSSPATRRTSRPPGSPDRAGTAPRRTILSQS